jgi:hypothetical protein
MKLGTLAVLSLLALSTVTGCAASGPQRSVVNHARLDSRTDMEGIYGPTPHAHQQFPASRQADAPAANVF